MNTLGPDPLILIFFFPANGFLFPLLLYLFCRQYECK